MDIDHSKLLKELAEPVQIGDRVKAQIQRASRLSGLPYWRTFDIWYGRYKRVDFRESDAIIHAVKLKRSEGEGNAIQRLQAEVLRLQSIHAQANADLDRSVFERSPNRTRPVGGGSVVMGRTLASR